MKNVGKTKNLEIKEDKNISLYDRKQMEQKLYIC